MLESLLERIATYPALFIACAFSGLGIPMPEDVPLIVAGLQLAQGDFALGPTLAAAIAGVLLRDVMAWSIGRLIGDRLLDNARFRQLVLSEKLDRATAMITERGAFAVLAGRFMFGFRVPMFFAAGAAGIPLRSFVAWDALGMAVTVPGVIAIGYFAGPPILIAALAVVPRIREILAVLLLGLGAWLYRRHTTKP